LCKAPRPYCAIQTSHGHAKEFFQNLYTIWACALKEVHQPWHRWSMAALIFCRRLAASDITVTPSVTYMDWLCWWYYHKNHLVISSTILAFVTNMSEKHKSTSPSAIQVKNQQKTIGNDEKSDVIIGLEKGEWNVDICRNVRHSSICTIRDNADRIKENAKPTIWNRECLWSTITTVPSEWTIPSNYGCKAPTFLLHYK